MAELEHYHIQSKMNVDSYMQQNGELESELLASTSASSNLELEKRYSYFFINNTRMMIDEIAELQNSVDAATKEIERNAFDKRGDANKNQKLEEKCKILMAVIGRMDDLQKSSQIQEQILSEMRGQLVSL